MKHQLKAITLLIIICASYTSCVSHKKTQAIVLPQENLGVVYGHTVNRFYRTLDPTQISFSYDANADIVIFHHKFLGDNIYIRLNSNGRSIFAKALQDYVKAYQDNTLTQEHEKKKAFFGQTECLMHWGIFGSGRQALPDLRFEYQLFDGRPYFIIASKSVPGETSGNSPAVRIALTPSQCDTLAQSLSDAGVARLKEEITKKYHSFDIEKKSEKNEDASKASFE